MTYNYQWNQHNEGLIQALDEQRNNRSHFCDITLTSKDLTGGSDTQLHIYLLTKTKNFDQNFYF